MTECRHADMLQNSNKLEEQLTNKSTNATTRGDDWLLVAITKKKNEKMEHTSNLFIAT